MATKHLKMTTGGGALIKKSTGVLIKQCETTCPWCDNSTEFIDVTFSGISMCNDTCFLWENPNPTLKNQAVLFEDVPNITGTHRLTQRAGYGSGNGYFCKWDDGTENLGVEGDYGTVSGWEGVGITDCSGEAYYSHELDYRGITILVWRDADPPNDYVCHLNAYYHYNGAASPSFDPGRAEMFYERDLDCDGECVNKTVNNNLCTTCPEYVLSQNFHPCIGNGGQATIAGVY